MGISAYFAWIVSATVMVGIMSSPVVIETLYAGTQGYFKDAEIGEKSTESSLGDCIWRCRDDSSCVSVNTRTLSDTEIECVMNSGDQSAPDGGTLTTDTGVFPDADQWLLWEKLP